MSVADGSNRVDRLSQLTRFGAVGVFNTVVGLLCIFAGLRYFGMSDVQANLFGYAIGLTVSYGLHRTWTFKHDGPVLNSFARFVVVIVVSYLANLLAMLLSHRAAGLNVYFSQCVGVAVYVVVSYLGSRHFAFRRI